MPTAMIVVLIALGVLWATATVTAIVCRRYTVREGGLLAGGVIFLFHVYARVVQRTRYEGTHRMPQGRRRSDVNAVPRRGDPPLIVVSNHTAGIDPILIQAGLPFEVRWMMAEDMRIAPLSWLWNFGRIIFVDRQRPDPAGMREALRHLALGGALGVFPEGAIERPHGQLLPFKDGVGLLIKRSGATVLPVIIEGTPESPTAWGSIWRPGKAYVRFLPLMTFAGRHEDAASITRKLQQVFLDATGWPMSETNAPLTGGSLGAR